MKCDSDGSRFARSLYIALSFSLAGAEEAFMFMALIGSTGRDDIYSAFMHSFFKHSERCEIATIELINPDELN